MRRFVRYICIILVLASLITLPAFASEQRSSDFFAASSVYLWKISDTQFEVWFDVTAVQSMDELGASEIKVQRSTDKENWTTMRTYSKANYSQMIDTHTATHADCVTYTYTSGYYYRAIVVLYAKNSSGTGEVTEVTPTKWF